MEDTKYLPELLAEKDSLDSSFTHAMKLISAEIDRIQKGETKKEPEKETYLDLFTTQTLKLKERVLIPSKHYPRVNFVGKILGPQGSTIKRLQEETGAKISVLGKGSMKDKTKEEELRNGGEAKYAHLAMELHVFIEVMAPIPDAYRRMAQAMDEVKKFLIPEPGEYDPYMDPHFLNGSHDGSARGRGQMGRGRGGPPGAGPRGRGLPRGGPRGGIRGGAPRGAMSRGNSRGGPASPNRGGAAARSRPPAAGAPRKALSHQKAPPSGTQPKPEPAYEGHEEFYEPVPYDTDTEYYDCVPQDAYEQYGPEEWDSTW
ncbi:KH domain-containing, RNA-binding, signal transduction-associated protein 2-like [Stigmatopora nigra]